MVRNLVFKPSTAILLATAMILSEMIEIFDVCLVCVLSEVFEFENSELKFGSNSLHYFCKRPHPSVTPCYIVCSLFSLHLTLPLFVSVNPKCDKIFATANIYLYSPLIIQWTVIHNKIIVVAVKLWLRPGRRSHRLIFPLCFNAS